VRKGKALRCLRKKEGVLDTKKKTIAETKKGKKKGGEGKQSFDMGKGGGAHWVPKKKTKKAGVLEGKGFSCEASVGGRKASSCRQGKGEEGKASDSLSKDSPRKGRSELLYF